MVLFSDLPTNLGNRSSRFPHSHRHDYDGIIPKTSRLRDTHSEGKVTFPCHNCARHIIGAGIKRVVYVEPYPKSRAKELHDDAIQIGYSNRNLGEEVVCFVPFVGISPRKYLDMFTTNPIYSTPVDRKLSNGHAINWTRHRTPLKTKMASLSYIEREIRAVSRLNETLQQGSLKLEN
jgi:hypothetical protein